MFGSSIAQPMHAVDAALPAVGNRLQLHDLRVIAAVVVHDVEKRNALVRGGPENAGAEHQIAVADEADAEAAVLLIGERGAEVAGEM